MPDSQGAEDQFKIFDPGGGVSEGWGGVCKTPPCVKSKVDYINTSHQR